MVTLYCGQINLGTLRAGKYFFQYDDFPPHPQSRACLDNNDMQIIEIRDHLKCHREQLSLLVLWGLL